MANLTLLGLNSGSTTLAPTDGANATLTLPTGTGTVVTTANPISGQVIQTVNTNFQATGASNYFSTSSTSDILRDPKLKKSVWADLQNVARELGLNLPGKERK